MPKTTVNFEEVKIKSTFKWMEDGKKRQKTEIFMQTINPFNKNWKGKMKSRKEIMKELIAKRDKWQRDMKAKHGVKEKQH